MRCRPRATDLGDSICSTRSTAPMSMPSSSEEVATRHGSAPAFSSSSTFVRSSRASEPWCARAISTGCGAVLALLVLELLRRELVQPQRDALGRAAVVDEHDRRGVLAHQPQQLRVDRRPDRGAWSPRSGSGRHRVQRVRARPPAAGRRARSSTRPGPRCAGRAACAPRRRRSSTSRPGPTRKRPISSSGFCVALRPIRWKAEPPAGRPAAVAHELLQALEREGEVRAALGVRDGVDLVDDHRVDRARASRAPAR